MPIGKFFGSAYRLAARAQGVVRVHVWGQTVTSVDPTDARKATVRRFGRSDRSAQATADLSEVGSLASEGGGDEDGQGLRLARQETRGGGEDPGEERLSRHTGSLLEDG
jgi:hypothetical protein